jgi:hypothetical protein
MASRPMTHVQDFDLIGLNAVKDFVPVRLTIFA